MRLLLIFGPPAVGKMTVGREVAARTTFRLFHNHHTIEPLLEVFGWGTPPFVTLNREFRIRVVEEAAAHEADLIFTYVWDLDSPRETAELRQLIAPYVRAGAGVRFVELSADLETRLGRNSTPGRLAAKPSKRDLDWSAANVREMDGMTLNTAVPGRPTPDVAATLLAEHPYLRLDTTELTAGDAADHIVDWIGPAT